MTRSLALLASLIALITTPAFSQEEATGPSAGNPTAASGYPQQPMMPARPMGQPMGADTRGLRERMTCERVRDRWAHDPRREMERMETELRRQRFLREYRPDRAVEEWNEFGFDCLPEGVKVPMAPPTGQIEFLPPAEGEPAGLRPVQPIQQPMGQPGYGVPQGRYPAAPPAGYRAPMRGYGAHPGYPPRHAYPAPYGYGYPAHRAPYMPY